MAINMVDVKIKIPDESLMGLAATCVKIITFVACKIFLTQMSLISGVFAGL